MGPDTDEELLDIGLRGRISLVSVVTVLVVLALGMGVGFLVGHRTRSASAPPPTRTRTVTEIPAEAATPAVVPDVFAEIDTTGQRCSTVLNGRLQLGIAVTNHANATLQFVEMSPVLPLGGLRMLASGIGSCGQLTPPTPISGYRFAPDVTIWLTATFDVEVRCPSFVPVSFLMHYREGGRTRTQSLSGFGDLGEVPYPCPSSSSR